MFSELEIKKHTPMMQQFMAIKNEHPDKLLFYRMGDFYELFFQDAIDASKILGITLTKRASNGVSQENGKSIPMAGVPFHAVDSYLSKLISEGLSVVVCEQVAIGENHKGIMQRKISKILTPGTIIEEGLLQPKETRYLCSIYKRSEKIELSWINLSSGEIWCQIKPYSDYVSIIEKIAPSEIIISEKQRNYFNINKQISCQYIEDWNYDYVTSKQNLQNLFGKNYIHQYGLIDEYIACTISSLINYIQVTQNTSVNHIQNIKWFKEEEFLQLDSNTKKHLETTQSTNKTTLLSVLDNCSTPMGSRLLKQWIDYPSRELNDLNTRLNIIEYLKSENKPYLSWHAIAQDWCDIERASSRISLKVIKPRELALLRDTLKSMPKLKIWSQNMPNELQGFFIHSIPSESIFNVLNKYLVEEPAVWIRDGGVIASGVDNELDEARSIQQGHSAFLKKYEISEKQKLNIPNLRVEYNGAQGFFISISNSHLDKIPANYKRKQTLKNNERFTTKELEEYEQKALSANSVALQREKIIYDSLLSQLQPFVKVLQQQAKILAKWDVLNNLANIADKNNLCRPQFNQSNVFELKQSRHMVVESSVTNFTANDFSLNENKKMKIITGPNMGGKSTYMRQIALIVIMAHIGSFVPAKYANIPEIDAIFTRIGAQDDISSGRSTFMVEMSETSFIINNATEKSLVLLDEIGRGTSTFDGLSLAWSIAEYISEEINSYCLFATHYQELTELAKEIQTVSNYHFDAIEIEDKIIFQHKIEDGIADKSYGIQVAALAGINNKIINNAKLKMAQFETKEKTNMPNKLEEKIKQLDIENMSPIQALVFLQKEQNKLKNGNQ